MCFFRHVWQRNPWVKTGEYDNSKYELKGVRYTVTIAGGHLLLGDVNLLGRGLPTTGRAGRLTNHRAGFNGNSDGKFDRITLIPIITLVDWRNWHPCAGMYTYLISRNNIPFKPFIQKLLSRYVHELIPAIDSESMNLPLAADQQDRSAPIIASPQIAVRSGQKFVAYKPTLYKYIM